MKKYLLICLLSIFSLPLYSQMLPSEETYNELRQMTSSPNTDYNNYRYVDVIEKRFYDHRMSPTLGSSNWSDILIWDTSQFNWRGNYQYFFDRMNTSYFSDFFTRLINGDRYNDQELNRFYDELRMEYEVPLEGEWYLFIPLLIIYYLFKRYKKINILI